jgi:hypothetical protein
MEPEIIGFQPQRAFQSGKKRGKGEILGNPD